MEDVRNCEQCRAEFEPQREHARFCSAACRVIWNRRHGRGWAVWDSPLNWSMSTLEDTTNRLSKAEAMNLPEALAVISETVWWVTVVDGTLTRYRHDIYDHAMNELGPAERKLIEGTLAGLRFARTCMGYYVDPADFIQPQQNALGGDAPVASWTWREVPAPVSTALPQRSKTWETGRYLHYRAYLADRPVGETISRATAFLTQLASRCAAS